jgi:citrate synthase
MTDAADLPALHLTAREAAAELGVSQATLYAYVSRGLIRSEARAGSRQRLYRADDVRALAARRGGERADPTAGAGAGRDGLAFGDPVLDSAITLITDDGLFYRGRNAARLAAEARLETVAGLIWEAAADPFAAAAPSVPETVARTAPALAALRPIDRCQALLPVVAAADPQAHNATPDGRHRTAARILRWMAALATGSDPDDRSIHEALVNGWGLDPAAANPLRIALALCADHELNASTFAVRVAASTGAPLHAAVQAGLATLSGPRHGGMTERAGALLDGLLTVPDPEAEFAERLRRGDDLPGFGHPLYPAGDPRAATLIAALETAFTGHPDLPAMRAIDTAARDRAGRPPTIDAALALLARLGGLPPGGALAVFAVGRCVGWIGHALEQQATGRLIRPRARYVGRRV